uniref:Putative secreted protein n=1 Tax=Anopheles darlingi TaxID=43151 RepID=A0A2M4DAT4_ANODA
MLASSALMALYLFCAAPGSSSSVSLSAGCCSGWDPSSPGSCIDPCDPIYRVPLTRQIDGRQPTSPSYPHYPKHSLWSCHPADCDRIRCWNHYWRCYIHHHHHRRSSRVPHDGVVCGLAGLRLACAAGASSAAISMLPDRVSRPGSLNHEGNCSVYPRPIHHHHRWHSNSCQQYHHHSP